MHDVSSEHWAVLRTNPRTITARVICELEGTAPVITSEIISIFRGLFEHSKKPKPSRKALETGYLFLLGFVSDSNFDEESLNNHSSSLDGSKTARAVCLRGSRGVNVHREVDVGLAQRSSPSSETRIHSHSPTRFQIGHN